MFKNKEVREKKILVTIQQLMKQVYSTLVSATTLQGLASLSVICDQKFSQRSDSFKQGKRRHTVRKRRCVTRYYE